MLNNDRHCLLFGTVSMIALILVVSYHMQADNPIQDCTYEFQGAVERQNDIDVLPVIEDREVEDHIPTLDAVPIGDEEADSTKGTDCPIQIGSVQRQLGQSNPHGVYLYVSYEYKFAMVHVLKSAGSTVSRFIGQVLCPNSARHFCKNKWDELTTGRLKDLGSDFFVFGIVRNPLDRFVSSYNFALGENFNKNNGKTVPFWEFCENPSSISRASRLGPNHWLPQTEFLFSNKGDVVVDYIARTERLDEDLPYILQKLSEHGASQILAEYNAGAFFSRNTHEHDPYPSYYDECKGCYEAVTKRYKGDMEAFGYLGMTEWTDTCH
eukprot:Rmarinus@m.12762